MPISQMISYRILLRKEPEGGYMVTVPSLRPFSPRMCYIWRINRRSNRNGKGSYRIILRKLKISSRRNPQ